MNKRILMGLGVLLLIILAAGGGFFAGTATAARNQPSFQGRFPDSEGQLGGPGGQFQRPGQGPGQADQPGQDVGSRPGGGTIGTIQSVEEDTIVITTQDDEIQVHTTDTTLIQKYMTVGVGDLAVNEQVMISGSQNDDGSITARSIQSVRNFQPSPTQ